MGTRGHGIVIGSGIAGLLAARVLAEHFERVTVLERDPAPEPGEPRKGIPQGHHVHVLLKAGEQVLDAFFPGLGEELGARGAVEVVVSRDLWWFHHGVWKVCFDDDLAVRTQSRPLLETLLRERVAAHERVNFRYGCRASEPLSEDDGRRIVGLRVESSGEETSEELRADLVVDASGRGSRLPRWLADLGFPPPEEERVGMNLQYATRLYRPTADPARPWRSLIVYQSPPEETRAGVILPVEGDRWQVTLIGYAGDHPPADEAGFLTFAKGLPRPHIFEAIRTATPLGEVKTHRFPHARMRRYDRLGRHPAGLFAFGDAVTSFDPVFGQGMTVVALCARALDRLLAKRPGLPEPRRVYRAQRKEAEVPWLLGACEDFRYPGTEGKRPPGIGALQGYVRQVIHLAAHDVKVHAQLLRVQHMLAGPETLFFPGVLTKVLGQSLGLRRGSFPYDRPIQVGLGSE